MGNGFDWTSAAIVAATLIGPVLAVQAQNWVERGREHQNRRIQIFRTLMATRAANLSAAHVEALNAIPIEFYGKKRQFKDVVAAWKTYLDQLTQQPVDAVWMQRRQDLFLELLWRLAVALRYNFSKLELQREVYSPIAHAKMEEDQEVIRQGLVKMFKGEAALPLDIRSFPVDQDMLGAQQELQKLTRSWLSGKQTVKVEVTEPKVK